MGHRETEAVSAEAERHAARLAELARQRPTDKMSELAEPTTDACLLRPGMLTIQTLVRKTISLLDPELVKTSGDEATGVETVSMEHDY